MTIAEIRELIALASETGIAELEVQHGEDRVRIRKSVGSRSGAVLPAGPPAGEVPAAATTSENPAPVLKTETPAPPTETQLIYAKSPIVGTFYESASPGTPPFVRIGEQVTPGQVLCIIESMKLMNEIEADVSGIIESKLVQNGQPVEYGEALFGIRPV